MRRRGNPEGCEVAYGDRGNLIKIAELVPSRIIVDKVTSEESLLAMTG